MFSAEVPQLESSRLLLRAVLPKDEEAFQVLCNDEDLAKATGMIPHPYPPGEAMRWIRETLEAQSKGERCTFAIILRDSGKVIGDLTFTGVAAHSKAEIGYIIGRKWWGQGYATEAVSRAVQWVFEEMPLRRVYGYCFSWNAASVRVLEKAGFSREGLLRENFCRAGTFEDEIVMAMTRTDWETLNTEPKA